MVLKLRGVVNTTDSARLFCVKIPGEGKQVLHTVYVPFQEKKMSFERKKERALAIMESKNMWRSNYAPPALRGLWKLGLKIPPLPFASFWQITVIMGSGFGFVWGLAMWSATWQGMGIPPSLAILRSLFCGVLFGAGMAAFHGWRRKVNGLPDWENL